MKLYTKYTRHCAPRDCQEFESFVLANDDEEMLVGCDEYGLWNDKHDEGEIYEIYNEDYNVIGTETYLEKMLRIRGEFNDEDADYSDAYYGITHIGWSEGVDISENDTNTLLRLGVVEDYRGKQKYNLGN